MNSVCSSPSLPRSFTISYAETLDLSAPLHATTDVTPPEPGDVQAVPVMTPLADEHEKPALDMAVRGVLAPTTVDPQRPQFLRPGPRLRLPSFHALGIASPHPDHLHMAPAGSSMAEETISPAIREARASAVVPSCPEVPGDAQCCPVPQRPSFLLRLPSSDALKTPTLLPCDIAALTPPSESGGSTWAPSSDSPPALMASLAGERGVPESGNAIQSEPRPPSNIVPSDTAALAFNLPNIQSLTPRHSWIRDAAAALLETMHTAARPSSALRVLSHALPSPSSAGHIYSTLINSIHASTPSSPTVWINVFHAIPGRFNLTDLPTSPPSTPGPAIGGDDYFTQKVFDSAVPISDYQEDLSSLPRSPRPVVPPSSVHVSIVERYIPPTNAREFSAMFNPKGPSILVDRLVEISPDNGCLVFIYPNRNGARAFMQDYLSPVLDPLLRSTVVVNGLSSDLSRTLGSMAAVDQLPSHEQLEHSMAVLCAQLTRPESSMRRFQENSSRFDLVHASTQKVHMPREAWARDWWAKQEKPKIREAMARYVQEAQKWKSNENVDRAATATELVEQLLAGVMQKPYPQGLEPAQGIEYAAAWNEIRNISRKRMDSNLSTPEGA